jgi:hypothetical protein
MMHDENIYPEPFKFEPERYLGSAPQLDPIPFVFGFGKRVCPGSHFAQLQFFMNVTSLLSVFKISRVLDENGQGIEPNVSWRTSTVAYVFILGHAMKTLDGSDIQPLGVVPMHVRVATEWRSLTRWSHRLVNAISDVIVCDRDSLDLCSEESHGMTHV